MQELSLVYVTYSVSQLPPLPLLGPEALAAIRYVGWCVTQIDAHIYIKAQLPPPSQQNTC